MLKNPNNAANAVFVPTTNGAFARYNALTGAPMPAAAADEFGLFDRDGKMHFGRLPASMATDAMPNLFDRGASDPRPPTSGAVMGSRDQGAGGTISREQAAAIHDACHHAGCDEVTMEHLGKALSAIVGPAAPAKDQNGGGGQKISHGAAKRFYDAVSPKLSPADCQTLIQNLMAMVDPNLPDPDEGEGGQTGDVPPPFAGRPTPGGQLVGDESARAAFLKDHPYMANVGHAPPYGEATPPSRYLREARQARMALDERQHSGGRDPHSLAESDPELFAAVSRIGRCY